MSTYLTRTLGRTGVLFAAGLVLSGCPEYQIETTLRPDGSGTREMRLEVSADEEQRRRADAYRAMLHLTEAEGWSHELGVDEDGATVPDEQRFYRKMDVESLEDWSRVSGSVTVDAVPPGARDRRVGYIRLGDVRLWNEVEVGRGRSSAGTTTLSYREVFRWDGGLETFVEMYVEMAERMLVTTYPRLSDDARSQIRGAFRARLWMAIEDGGVEALNSSAWGESHLPDVAADVARQAVRLLPARYSSTTETVLADQFMRVLEGDFDVDLEELAPGLEFVAWSEFVVRVRLPGRVVSSNADREEDGVLEWEFDVEDLWSGSFEVRAESVIEGS